MKFRPFKDPYVTSALVLLVSAWLCAWLWGWGPLVFAFFLMLYFIVALGIRLDEITGQMRDTGRRLDRFLALEERRYHQTRTVGAPPGPTADSPAPESDMEGLRNRLDAIDAALGRLEKRSGTERLP